MIAAATALVFAPPAFPNEGDRIWSPVVELAGGGRGDEATEPDAGAPFESKEEGKEDGAGEGLAAHGCCEFC